jgi:hypothetical protein
VGDVGTRDAHFESLRLPALARARPPHASFNLQLGMPHRLHTTYVHTDSYSAVPLVLRRIDASIRDNAITGIGVPRISTDTLN